MVVMIDLIQLDYIFDVIMYKTFICICILYVILFYNITYIFTQAMLKLVIIEIKSTFIWELEIVSMFNIFFDYYNKPYTFISVVNIEVCMCLCRMSWDSHVFCSRFITFPSWILKNIQQKGCKTCLFIHPMI